MGAWCSAFCWPTRLEVSGQRPRGSWSSRSCITAATASRCSRWAAPPSTGRQSGWAGQPSCGPGAQRAQWHLDDCQRQGNQRRGSQATTANAPVCHCRVHKRAMSRCGRARPPSALPWAAKQQQRRFRCASSGGGGGGQAFGSSASPATAADAVRSVGGCACCAHRMAACDVCAFLLLPQVGELDSNFDGKPDVIHFRARLPPGGPPVHSVKLLLQLTYALSGAARVKMHSLAYVAAASPLPGAALDVDGQVRAAVAARLSASVIALLCGGARSASRV